MAAVKSRDGRHHRATFAAALAAGKVGVPTKAAGKWNTFKITAKGRQMTVGLNGLKTVELHNGLLIEAPGRCDQVSLGGNQAVLAKRQSSLAAQHQPALWRSKTAPAALAATFLPHFRQLRQA
jgi:hypothetical protein